MRPAGYEQTHQTPENRTPAAQSGPKSGPVDPELQIIVDRWHELPPLIRRQIVKLADSGGLTLAGVRGEFCTATSLARGEVKGQKRQANSNKR